MATPAERQRTEVPLPQPRVLPRERLVWPDPTACGAFSCFVFDHPDQAMVALILHEKARVVGLGEAHAPAEYRGTSTVHRFSHEILPALGSGASFLLVELLAPPADGCEQEKKVAKKESDAITRGQSQNNQNQYLELGNVAAHLGVVPDLLRASCEDMRRIAAPDGGVLAYMETIARLFVRELSSRLTQTKKGRPLVLAYGGALHNDALPRPGRESWSYGVELAQDPTARYLEIDLVIPELIGDSEGWRGFAWYETYRQLEHREGVLLLEVAPRSFVLFFEPEPQHALAASR